MNVHYLHLVSEQVPPKLSPTVFRVVIVADVAVEESWRKLISDWLVKSGCLFVVAWGVDCQAWHDEVDHSVLEMFGDSEIPDDQFVNTTWHDDETLSEAFHFLEHLATHSVVELSETIIIHIALQSQESNLLQIYRESQSFPA
jgi:hypothetical protein